MNKYLTLLFLMVPLVLSGQTFNVGDYTINKKTAVTGSLTPKYWAGANSTLWGTNGSGDPQSITIGSGLNLTGSTLTATAGGDVVGPASSTDNAIVRFDGATGKLIQNSGITIADGATGTLSGTNSGDVTVLDGNTINFTLAGQQITAEAITQLSITSDASGLKLVGDVNAPGNSYYYGTDGTGTKGYFALPSGTPGGSDTQLQYNNAGSFGGMSGTSWDDTNRSLTITGATVTASEPIFDLTQTWNNGAVTFTGIKLNVTDTASAAASNLLEMQVGASPVFEVRKDGSAQISNGLRLQDAGVALADPSRTNSLYVTQDSLGISVQGQGSIYTLVAMTAGEGYTSPFFPGRIITDDTRIMTVRDGTSPMKFRVAETYTDNGNYEAVLIDAASGINAIRPDAAGTGTASKLDYHLTATDVRITSGTGTPEGAVSAAVGSIYLRTDGGTNTAVYRKESGTGNTGWVAVVNGTGTGDVVGPASATDNAVALFDNTTGKLIKNSTLIFNTGALSGVTTLATPEYIDFDNALGVAPAYQGGRLFYDDTNDALTYYPNTTSDSMLQIGQESWVRVRNNTGSTITNGQVVYVSGAVGQLATIALAQANSFSTSQIIGIATHDIANNTNGFVTVFGEVRGLDLSAFTEGDELYLSAATPGALTATAPTAPNIAVRVGIVEHAHITQGKLLVHPDVQSISADDLYDSTAAARTLVTSLDSSAGLLAQTGATAFAKRTITGTANEITVTDGDGVSGNPTISIPATIDLGGKTSLEIPNSAAPTVDANGEIAVDTTVADFSHGLIKYYSGEEVTVVALPTANLTSPTNNYVVTYDGTADEFKLAAQSGGGSNYAVLGSNVAITDNATLQNITGLSFAVAANTVYEATFYVDFTTSAAGTGSEIGITGPSSPAGFIAEGYTSNTATAESNGIATAYGTIVSNANGNTASRPVRVHLFFRNGANAGTVQLQAKVETAVSGTVTALAGSAVVWRVVTTP